MSFNSTTDTESQHLLEDFKHDMSTVIQNQDGSQDIIRMRRLPTEYPETPSHVITTSPEALPSFASPGRPGLEHRSSSQKTNDSSKDPYTKASGGRPNPPRRPVFSKDWWSSVSDDIEREGQKIDGVFSIPIPYTGRYLRFRIFRWWLSFDGLVMVGILVLYTILALFAWNSTRADHNNAFVLPSTDSIFVITTLSTAGTTLIGMLVGSALEAVRWRKAVRGVHAATFLGLSQATGVQGRLALLRSSPVALSTKVWVMIVFAFAGVNYLLSNILTVGLTSATIFRVNDWKVNTMSGIGPWIPYDMTTLLYPTNTNMSIRIAYTYDSFTSDTTQVYQLTSNITKFTGSQYTPTSTVRTLCDDGCFAYMLPGTIGQIITSGPQPPLGQFYCNGANPQDCINPPFVFDVDGLQALYVCEPSDQLCVANALLNDRKSPNRSSYSTINTNLTSWNNFNISDTLRTHGPAAVLYYEPFTYDGPAAASNMTACQLFTPHPYAMNICYKEMDSSSIAIGWATCDPVLHNCTLSDTAWRENLTSSTILSFEQHYVGLIHSLPTGALTGIEIFDAPTPLTINSTQFFTVVANIFAQGTAITNLIYNTAISPDLARFGADLHMRDLLSCTYSIGASQIQVDAPAGADVPWSNAGEAGIDTATDRIVLSLTSIIIFAVFAALTLILCALMFAYSSSEITPNNTDFAELDITARASHLHLFDGLSNADNDEIVSKIGQEYLWLGESEDGRSVEISSEKLTPLQLRKAYF